MTDSCIASVSCPNGNCPGCKNGKLWCDDPRCSPQCTNCGITPHYNSFALITIAIIVLMFIVALVILVVAFGHGLTYSI